MPKFKTMMYVEVEVEYEVEPSQTGCRNSMGAPEEPSCDAYPDDIIVTFPKYEDLSSDDKEYLYEECEEHLETLCEE